MESGVYVDGHHTCSIVTLPVLSTILPYIRNEDTSKMSEMCNIPQMGSSSHLSAHRHIDMAVEGL